MARSRNIKPSIMDNEDLAELEPLTRLLFIYLWMLADREGRLEDRPKRIAGQALAYDRSADVDALLNDLQESGFIKRYTIGAKACIQIVNFAKHQSPHGTEKDSELPRQDGLIVRNERKSNGFITGVVSLDNSLLTVNAPLNTGASTVKDSLNNESKTVKPPLLNALIPDSGFLNQDTRTLIPDSLIPDSKTNTLFGEAPSEPSPVKVKTVKVEKPAKEPPPSAEAWNAYAQAYRQRYQAEPVRNARVNGQMAQLVGRIGAEEAPQVAAWYVGHRNQRYVANGHSVGLLLMDCEKLRTEWATGRQVTQTQAIQSDKTQANFNVFDRMIQEAKAREAANGS